jgi:hypothetical protein
MEADQVGFYRSRLIHLFLASQVSPTKEYSNSGFQASESVPNHPITPNSPPPGILDDTMPPQDGYGLVINGEALSYALKRNYEKLFLEVGSCCSVRSELTFNLMDCCLGSYLLSSYSTSEGTSC